MEDAFFSQLDGNAVRELLLRTDGSVELIRRAETIDDYFATLVW